MTLDDVLKLINQVGLPIGLLMVMLWFGGKFLWPFFVKQLEDSHTSREQSQTIFLESLRYINEEIVKKLDLIASKLNGEKK